MLKITGKGNPSFVPVIVLMQQKGPFKDGLNLF